MKSVLQRRSASNWSAHSSRGRRSRFRIALILLSSGLLTCWLLALAACQKPEVKPVEIVQGDVCFRCKMPIAEKQYAAEFATKDGFVRKFDDIGCMVQHAQGKVGKANIIAYFAVDYGSKDKQWMKAEDASYVKSEKFQTPMNGGTLAFKDKGQAEAIAKQFQAQLLTFDQLLK